MCRAVPNPNLTIRNFFIAVSQCALQRDSRERAERDVCVPTQILPSLKVRQLASGGMHSVALTMEGEVCSRNSQVASNGMSRGGVAACQMDAPPRYHALTPPF